MALTLNTQIPSFSCLHLPAFSSHATIVYEKSGPPFSLFPIEKPKLQNLTLRSTQGHHLN